MCIFVTLHEFYAGALNYQFSFFSVCFLLLLSVCIHTMAADQEIVRVLAQADGISLTGAQDQIDLALKEISKLLAATGDSLMLICKAMEDASSREELCQAFKRFNGITRILLEAVPESEFDQMVLNTGRSLELSPKLNNFHRATSLRGGLRSYKTAIV